MTALATRVRTGRARVARARSLRHGAARVLAGLTLVATAACGSSDGPEQELAAVKPPSWFTAPQDGAEPDADPPRWTRRYAELPRSESDVEMVYSQALDRAGWRYHAGDCRGVGAPEGGRVSTDCWTRAGYVLAFTAAAGASAETGPTSLDVVLHQADRSNPSPSKA